MCFVSFVLKLAEFVHDKYGKNAFLDNDEDEVNFVLLFIIL